MKKEIKKIRELLESPDEAANILGVTLAQTVLSDEDKEFILFDMCKFVIRLINQSDIITEMYDYYKGKGKFYGGTLSRLKQRSGIEIVCNIYGEEHFLMLFDGKRLRADISKRNFSVNFVSDKTLRSNIEKGLKTILLTRATKRNR